jgi:hypothetical protein
MTRKANYFHQVIKTLEELHKQFPKYNLGKHLSTALDGHDIWAMSDKDVLQCLRDYKTELEMDIPHKDDDVEDIIKQGLNLHNILDDED